MADLLARSRASTGGLLFEINVHEFDFMRAILERRLMSAMATNIAHPEQDYEDHAVVTVRFRNGAIAFLETSTATALGATEGPDHGGAGLHCLRLGAQQHQLSPHRVRPRR